MKTITFFRKLIWILILSSFYYQAYAQESEVILNESFDNVSGKGWGGTDFSTELTSNLDQYTSVSGWTGIKIYNAPGAIKLGSGSSLGSITTPEINISDPTATYTLTVNASSWNKKYSVIYVQVDGEDVYEISGLENSSDYENTLKNQSFTITLPTGTAASKITFTSKVKDKAFFLDNIVITKTGGSGVVLKDPQASFSTEAATYTLGEAFSAPTFTTVSDGEVTYKSSNTNVATIDSEGNVTAIAAGTTTITASVSATETYAAGNASYTLTVVDPNILLSEDFANGLSNFTKTGDVWKTGKYNDQSYAQANANKMGAQTDMLISPLVDLSEANNAVLTFDHATGYIGDNDPMVDFTLWIKEESASDWTQLNIPTYPESKSSGWSAFVSSEEIGLQTYCGKKVQIAFQYKSSEEKQSGWEVTNILIRKAETATVTIPVSEAGYATYFSDQAWVVADNMKAGIVTGVENKNLTIDWKYAAGSVVPANTAVLIQAAAKDYVCEVSNSEEVAPAENLLKGSTTAATTEGENCLFYKLSYDNNGENLGFYWAVEDGAAFTSEANKAYLALTTTTAQNVRGFGLEGDGTTGISQIENGEAIVNVYTIDGIIVRKQVKESQALNGLKKGIYIVNGKKIIK